MNRVRNRTILLFCAFASMGGALCFVGCDADKLPAAPSVPVPEPEAAVVATQRQSATASCTIPVGSCAGYNCLKNVYWGDLHLHTSYSLDSYTVANRNDPKDAYAYARGATLNVAEGSGGTATSKIDRHLDFLAVTDHAEFLSSTGQCLLGFPGSAAYCAGYTDQGSVSQGLARNQAGAILQNPAPPDMLQCQGDPAAAACATASKGAWASLQQAANAANEQCKFTSLYGYEWSAITDGANLHRNVIFGSDKVPAEVYDYIRKPTPVELWQALDDNCKIENGCDALTIPHNSNLSFGTMWDTAGPPTAPNATAVALMRKYQTLAEIFQHKGNSECAPGDPLADPDCAFEQVTGTLIGGVNGNQGGDATTPDAGPGMIRNGLALGLAHVAANPTNPNANPLEMGFVGATDNHNGLAGAVDEGNADAGAPWVGALSQGDDTPEERLADYPTFNPGGITGVWAEQNTRASIFGALKRREVFGTTGPRIAVRFFAIDAANDTAAAAYCADPDFPSKLVAAKAATMGAVSTGMAGKPPPYLFVAAMRDASGMGRPLDRIDFVRLAPDASGAITHFIESKSVAGASSTCKFWKDPGYRSGVASLYYARVFQQPTWRWSHYDCQVAPDAGGCNPGGELDVKVRERAWSSPIFFRP